MSSRSTVPGSQFRPGLLPRCIGSEVPRETPRGGSAPSLSRGSAFSARYDTFIASVVAIIETPCGSCPSSRLQGFQARLYVPAPREYRVRSSAPDRKQSTHSGEFR